MAFDGIVTKAIVLELQQLIGGRIDKIYEPTKNDILLGFYLNGVNYALNIFSNFPSITCASPIFLFSISSAAKCILFPAVDAQ